MPRPRKNGRNRPRIPVNVVYRTIQASAGPTAVCTALGISLASLARWRREGRIGDARIVLEWAALVWPLEPGRQLALARRLAGLPATPRPGRR